MSSPSLTREYDKLPKYVRIIIQAFLGAIVGGAYRIFKYTETKNALTLVAGILNFVGLGLVFWIVDLVTAILGDGITVLAD